MDGLMVNCPKAVNSHTHVNTAENPKLHNRTKQSYIQLMDYSMLEISCVYYM